MAASIAARDRTLGPATLDTRYVLEDVPFGLLPTTASGRASPGVPTPLHDAGIAMLSAMYGRDSPAPTTISCRRSGSPSMSIGRCRRLARDGWARAVPVRPHG